MIDASITKEYYRQFLRYVGKADLYTALVQPIATSTVTLFTPDFSERIRCTEPDSLFRILELSGLTSSLGDTGQATFYQKTNLEHKLNTDQIQSVHHNGDLLQVWQKTIRPTTTKLIG